MKKQSKLKKISFNDNYSIFEKTDNQKAILTIGFNPELSNIDEIILKENNLILLGTNHKGKKTIGYISKLESAAVSFLKIKKNIKLTILDQKTDKIILINDFDIKYD